MLLNGEQLNNILSAYRLCWIGGRFGGHKTSLAFELSKPFLNDGYKLFTNTFSVWDDTQWFLKECNGQMLDEHKQLKAVVILDEIGVEAKVNQQIERIAHYARKMDIVYLFPSFWAPPRAAQVLTISYQFDFRGIGIPAIVYRWKITRSGMADSDWFMWFNPSSIYGTYSTRHPGYSMQKITNILLEATKQFETHYGKDGEGEDELYEVGAGDILQDVAEQLRDTGDEFQQAAVSFRRQRAKKLF